MVKMVHFSVWYSSRKTSHHCYRRILQQTALLMPIISIYKQSLPKRLYFCGKKCQTHLFPVPNCCKTNASTTLTGKVDTMFTRVEHADIPVLSLFRQIALNR
jgi:predicted alpha/beta hydrolase